MNRSHQKSGPSKPSLDTICQQIACGRQLARQLTSALRGQAVGEAELRLLWLLSRQTTAGLQQSGLAEQLGVSPAQVSSMVDNLRRQQIIQPITDENDRRRQRWQLTASGCQQLEAVTIAVELYFRDHERTLPNQMRARSPQEDAA